MIRRRYGMVLAAALVVAASMGMVEPAQAQEQQAELNISWVRPTTATDGTALTGANAYTKTQIFVSKTPIADGATITPVAEVGPTVVSAKHSISVAPGGTIYIRLKGCIASGCSVFTPQVSKVLTIVRPSVPSDVKLTITVVVAQ